MPLAMRCNTLEIKSKLRLAAGGGGSYRRINWTSKKQTSSTRATNLGDVELLGSNNDWADEAQENEASHDAISHGRRKMLWEIRSEPTKHLMMKSSTSHITALMTRHTALSSRGYTDVAPRT
jgi:hypothetical protein